MVVWLFPLVGEGLLGQAWSSLVQRRPPSAQASAADSSKLDSKLLELCDSAHLESSKADDSADRWTELETMQQAPAREQICGYWTTCVCAHGSKPANKEGSRCVRGRYRIQSRRSIPRSFALHRRVELAVSHRAVDESFGRLCDRLRPFALDCASIPSTQQAIADENMSDGPCMYPCSVMTTAADRLDHHSSHRGRAMRWSVSRERCGVNGPEGCVCSSYWQQMRRSPRTRASSPIGRCKCS